MTAAAPRHFLSASPFAPLAPWLASGTNEDRLSRIAARRSFVHVKRCFMAAVERVAGQRGQWLRQQLRQANEAVDLWLLRGAVFDALQARGPEGREVTRVLKRSLDSIFPEAIEAAPTMPM
jgi:hypothetical protein